MAQEKSIQPGIRGWIQSVRPAPVWFIVLAIVVYMAMAYLVNIVATPSQLLPSLPAATGYVVSKTFLNAIPFIIVVGSLLVLVGRFRWNDLGFSFQKLLSALAWVCGTWIVAQLFFLLVHLGEVSLDPDWQRMGIRNISNLVTGQLLGNSLVEEVFWRAFMISQLVLVLVHGMKWSFSKAIGWAIIVVAILFALSHLPHDVANDRSVQQVIGMQVARLAGGLAFAGIFLLSRNIFVAIGLHGLVDVPLSLFEVNAEQMSAFMALAPFLVLATLAIRRRLAT